MSETTVPLRLKRVALSSAMTKHTPVGHGFTACGLRVGSAWNEYLCKPDDPDGCLECAKVEAMKVGFLQKRGTA